MKGIAGVVTSGTDWLFLKLVEKSVHVDLNIYQIAQSGLTQMEKRKRIFGLKIVISLCLTP